MSARVALSSRSSPDDVDVYYPKGRRPREDEEGEESYEKPMKDIEETDISRLVPTDLSPARVGAFGNCLRTRALKKCFLQKGLFD